MPVRFFISEFLPIIVLGLGVAITWFYDRSNFILIGFLAWILLQHTRLRESLSEEAREISVLRSDHRMTVALTKLLLIVVILFGCEFGRTSGLIDLTEYFATSVDQPVALDNSTPSDPKNRVEEATNGSESTDEPDRSTSANLAGDHNPDTFDPLDESSDGGRGDLTSSTGDPPVPIEPKDIESKELVPGTDGDIDPPDDVVEDEEEPLIKDLRIEME